MSRRSSFALAFAALALLPLAAHAGDARPLGTAILARPGGDALLIWDASADVASIVANQSPDPAANAVLERDAARVLAASLAKIDPSARTVTVRVVYRRTGAVSPVYGSATFAGVERYATLELTGKDAFGNRDRWRTLGDADPIPRWFAFTVIGNLPAR